MRMATSTTTPTDTASRCPISTHITCDMRGPGHTTPATHIVDAKVLIGVDDYEPLSWLVCSDLACHYDAAAHAEGIGQHVDTRPLTVVEAEELTGLVAQ